jgi:hypothetical protein
MPINKNIITNQINKSEYDNLDAINYSGLKHFMISPAHYFHWKNNKEESDNPAFAIGNAVHCLALEPSEFTSKFVVAPDVDRRTKEGKRIWEEFKLTAEGKQVIGADDYSQSLNIAKSIIDNPVFQTYATEGAIIEAGLHTELHGNEFKCRIDLYDQTLNTIVDIKTYTGNVTNGNIASEIFKRGYDIQSYCYREAVKNVVGTLPNFVFIFVEKEPPYAVNTCVIGPSNHSRTGEYVEKSLTRFANCKVSQVWPSYDCSTNPYVIEPKQYV